MAETNSKEKTVFERLAKARTEIKVQQTGQNKYANYKYFELADILPAITKAEAENGIASVFGFTPSLATLTIYNSDNREDSIEYSIPVEAISSKQMSPIQIIGALTTYTRRYLLMIAYNIAEADQLEKETDITERDFSVDPRPNGKKWSEFSQTDLEKTINKMSKAIESGGKDYLIPYVEKAKETYSNLYPTVEKQEPVVQGVEKGFANPDPDLFDEILGG